MRLRARERVKHVAFDVESRNDTFFDCGRRRRADSDDALDLDAFDLSESESEGREGLKSTSEVGATKEAVEVEARDEDEGRAREDANADAKDVNADATNVKAIEAPTEPKEAPLVFKVPASRVPWAVEGGSITVVAPTPRPAPAPAPRPTLQTLDDEETEAVTAEQVKEVMRFSVMDDFDDDVFNVADEDAVEATDAAVEAEMARMDDEGVEREQLARCSARIDELRAEMDEAVMASTELLLKTITSTNDYFLLFNPKLMMELRSIKEKARAWLDEAPGKRT